MKRIDGHVHIGVGVRMSLGVDELLGQMDEAGIDLAVVCPMDRYIAVANREGNELVLQAVREHPDRLVGMAVANPWLGAEAEEELRRALEEGLMGLKINSVLQGFRLSEHLVDGVLGVAEEFGVPVYAHTGTAGAAEPFHLVELARRFPKVNFIMGHAGATDYYNDTVRAFEFADNMWVETSRNGPANFCHFLQYERLSGRVVFGSNCPDYIPRVEMENLCDIFVEAEMQQSVFYDAIAAAFKGRLPI